MLTEENVFSDVVVRSDGQMQVNRALVVKRDGVEIARVPSPRSFDPAMQRDRDDMVQEDARVKAIADIIWTPEVIAAREEASRPPARPVT